MQLPRRVPIVTIVVALLASVLALTAAPASAALTTRWTTAAADGRVEAQNPSANFGDGPLHVAGSPKAVSYLRFNVPTNNGDPLFRAILRLYSTVTDFNGVDIRLAGTNSWSESTLTYTHRPSTLSGLVGQTGRLTRHEWVGVDVTDYVTPGQAVSFALSGTGNAWFHSSEGQFTPKMRLEFGAPDVEIQSANVTVNVDRSDKVRDSEMAVGTTMNQFTLRPDGDPAAIARGRQLQREAAVYQIQPIMGNGARNPNPSPGVYDWESLDDQIAQIEETGGIPVINLWGAPDWMKGGQPGETIWGKQEIAPLPEHYNDFAELARRAAIRYPQVQHWIVWNEAKGLWNRDMKNYDYVAYTKMYNKVYDAVKAVDSSNQVGGPYLVIEGTGSLADDRLFTKEPIIDRNFQFLEYFFDNMRGMDFLALDRKLAQRKDDINYSFDESMALTDWFGEVTTRIQAMNSTPIWWVESYFRCDVDADYMAAGMASMLRHQLLAGSAVSLRWSPEMQPYEDPNNCDQLADGNQNLWTSTQVAGGGQALPAHGVYKAFKDFFGPGRSIYRSTSSSSQVEVLANWNNTLLINKSDQTRFVDIDGDTVVLDPYAVLVHTR